MRKIVSCRIVSVTDENPAFGTPLIGFPEHSSQPLFLCTYFVYS